MKKREFQPNTVVGDKKTCYGKAEKGQMVRVLPGHFDNTSYNFISDNNEEKRIEGRVIDVGQTTVSICTSSDKGKCGECIFDSARCNFSSKRAAPLGAEL